MLGRDPSSSSNLPKTPTQGAPQESFEKVVIRLRKTVDSLEDKVLSDMLALHSMNTLCNLFWELPKRMQHRAVRLINPERRELFEGKLLGSTFHVIKKRYYVSDALRFMESDETREPHSLIVSHYDDPDFQSAELTHSFSMVIRRQLVLLAMIPMRDLQQAVALGEREWEKWQATSPGGSFQEVKTANGSWYAYQDTSTSQVDFGIAFPPVEDPAPDRPPYRVFSHLKLGDVFVNLGDFMKTGDVFLLLDGRDTEKIWMSESPEEALRQVVDPAFPGPWAQGDLWRPVPDG